MRLRSLYSPVLEPETTTTSPPTLCVERYQEYQRSYGENALAMETRIPVQMPGLATSARRQQPDLNMYDRNRIDPDIFGGIRC